MLQGKQVGQIEAILFLLGNRRSDDGISRSKLESDSRPQNSEGQTLHCKALCLDILSIKYCLTDSVS